MIRLWLDPCSSSMPAESAVSHQERSVYRMQCSHRLCRISLWLDISRYIPTFAAVGCVIPSNHIVL